MSDHLRINSPVAACQVIDGEAVLIHFDRGQYYSSLGTGGEIIRMLEAGYGVGTVVAALAPDRPTAEIEQAVRSFVGELLREGLFVNGPNGARDAAVDARLLSGQPFEAPVLNKYSELEDLLKLDPIHDVDPAGWPLRAE